LSSRQRSVFDQTSNVPHIPPLLPLSRRVLQAMELLGSRGFHRALVPNMCPCDHDQTTAMPMPALLQSRLGGGEGGTAGEEYRVLSQMDIAAFMLKHEGLLGLALAKSIDDIGLVWPSVVSVTPSTPLLDAFNMFRIRGISAVAVVQPKPAPPAVVVEEGGGDSKDEEGGTEKTKEASVVLPQWPMGGCGSVLTGTLSASDVKQRLFSASCAFPASQPPMPLLCAMCSPC
ncbi:unnamed protein product, partial [Closterium sp. Naga37s-1]